MRLLVLLTVLLSWTLSGCGSQEGAPVADLEEGEKTTASAASPGKPAEPAMDDLHPEVVLNTSLGAIKVKLDAEKAPLTVRNFLEYVNSGHYDGTIFHQVEKGFIVLGGGYSVDMTEKRAQMPIRNEAHNGRKNLRGTIAMARFPDNVDSATSQFFINLSDNPVLDHQGDDQYGYCVFGEVISGLEVVEKIAEAEARDADKFQNVPVDPIAIQSARRLR